jgi:hypothetical protein
MHKATLVLEEKAISVHYSIAQYYWLDARDFLSRFDALWEVETNKTGRIKTFVDLLMGCECALKSHVMLGLEKLCPKEAYSTLRGASHSISTLVDAAQLNKDRSDYDFLKNELSDFPIKIRYSLDAYDTFFPMLCDWSEADINHSKTIGCHPWVMSIRNALSRLVEDINPHFTGLVSNDLAAIFRNEKEVKAVITGYRR